MCASTCGCKFNKECTNTDYGLRIRIGVWEGDVTNCVGVNYCGMIQYYGEAYNQVKKYEESTDSSLALMPKFYEKIENYWENYLKQELEDNGYKQTNKSSKK